MIVERRRYRKPCPSGIVSRMKLLRRVPFLALLTRGCGDTSLATRPVGSDECDHGNPNGTGIHAGASVDHCVATSAGRSCPPGLALPACAAALPRGPADRPFARGALAGALP